MAATCSKTRTWAPRVLGAALLASDGAHGAAQQMAFAVTSPAQPGDAPKVAAVCGRLPLQIPMIWAALQNEPRR